MVQKPLIKQGYSLAEEIANSVSHGIGLVFGIVGLVLLLVQANTFTLIRFTAQMISTTLSTQIQCGTVGNQTPI